jgi:hypothetical protein
MDRFDMLLIAGIVLAAIGLGLIYFPLGLIAIGAGCIALSLIGARGETAPRAAVDSRQKHAGMTEK